MMHWLEHYNLIANTLQLLILGGIIHLVILGHYRSRKANKAYKSLLEQLHDTLQIMTEVSERQLAWLQKWPHLGDVPSPPPAPMPKEPGDAQPES